MISTIPIFWCLNILSHSHFTIRLYEWQAESGKIVLRIRGKQWYWVYKVDLINDENIETLVKVINIGYNKQPQFLDKPYYDDSITSSNYIQYMYGTRYCEKELRDDVNMLNTKFKFPTRCFSLFGTINKRYDYPTFFYSKKKNNFFFGTKSNRDVLGELPAELEYYDLPKYMSLQTRYFGDLKQFPNITDSNLSKRVNFFKRLPCMQIMDVYLVNAMYNQFFNEVITDKDSVKIDPVSLHNATHSLDPIKQPDDSILVYKMGLEDYSHKIISVHIRKKLWFALHIGKKTESLIESLEKPFRLNSFKKLINSIYNESYRTRHLNNALKKKRLHRLVFVDKSFAFLKNPTENTLITDQRILRSKTRKYDRYVQNLNSKTISGINGYMNDKIKLSFLNYKYGFRFLSDCGKKHLAIMRKFLTKKKKINKFSTFTIKGTPLLYFYIEKSKQKAINLKNTKNTLCKLKTVARYMNKNTFRHNNLIFRHLLLKTFVSTKSAEEWAFDLFLFLKAKIKESRKLYIFENKYRLKNLNERYSIISGYKGWYTQRCYHMKSVSLINSDSLRKLFIKWAYANNTKEREVIKNWFSSDFKLFGKEVLNYLNYRILTDKSFENVLNKDKTNFLKRKVVFVSLNSLTGRLLRSKSLAGFSNCLNSLKKINKSLINSRDPSFFKKEVFRNLKILNSLNRDFFFNNMERSFTFKKNKLDMDSVKKTLIFNKKSVSKSLKRSYMRGKKKDYFINFYKKKESNKNRIVSINRSLLKTLFDSYSSQSSLKEAIDFSLQTRDSFLYKRLRNRLHSVPGNVPDYKIPNIKFISNGDDVYVFNKKGGTTLLPIKTLLNYSFFRRTSGKMKKALFEDVKVRNRVNFRFMMAVIKNYLDFNGNISQYAKNSTDVYVLLDLPFKKLSLMEKNHVYKNSFFRRTILNKFSALEKNPYSHKKTILLEIKKHRSQEKKQKIFYSSLQKKEAYCVYSRIFNKLRLIKKSKKLHIYESKRNGNFEFFKNISKNIRKFNYVSKINKKKFFLKKMLTLLSQNKKYIISGIKSELLLVKKKKYLMNAILRGMDYKFLLISKNFHIHLLRRSKKLSTYINLVNLDILKRLIKAEKYYNNLNKGILNITFRPYEDTHIFTKELTYYTHRKNLAIWANFHSIRFNVKRASFWGWPKSEIVNKIKFSLANKKTHFKLKKNGNLFKAPYKWSKENFLGQKKKNRFFLSIKKKIFNSSRISYDSPSFKKKIYEILKSSTRSSLELQKEKKKLFSYVVNINKNSNKKNLNFLGYVKKPKSVVVGPDILFLRNYKHDMIENIKQGKKLTIRRLSKFYTARLHSTFKTLSFFKKSNLVEFIESYPLNNRELVLQSNKAALPFQRLIYLIYGKKKIKSYKIAMLSFAKVDVRKNTYLAWKKDPESFIQKPKFAKYLNTRISKKKKKDNQLSNQLDLRLEGGANYYFKARTTHRWVRNNYLATEEFKMIDGIDWEYEVISLKFDVGPEKGFRHCESNRPLNFHQKRVEKLKFFSEEGREESLLGRDHESLWEIKNKNVLERQDYRDTWWNEIKKKSTQFGLKDNLSRFDKRYPHQKRLLWVHRQIILPVLVSITVITNSYDVIHSWFVPGLGLKMDCVPGRSTHHTIHIEKLGYYYGQCAEVCGRRHHHMPIKILAVPYKYYIWWYRHVTDYNSGLGPYGDGPGIPKKKK